MKATWILIANASEARLFQTKKNPKDMRLIFQFYHPESRLKDIQLVTDGAGKYRQTPRTPKSAYEGPTNPKQVEIERFAHELAHKLNEGRNSHAYENLVVIAPSHIQGLLNKFCNSHVKNLIMVTLDKDYTKLRKEELVEYLDGRIRIRYAA